MPHYLTKEGLEKLRKELGHLKSVTRKEIIERIATAKELGDLKENAEYAEAKDDQALVESKIYDLEDKVKNAVVIKENNEDHYTVTIGSTVVATSMAGKVEYTIVGSDEADPVKGRISHESPIGKAFLGKRKGEKIVVKAPKGEFEYTVTDIR